MQLFISESIATGFVQLYSSLNIPKKGRAMMDKKIKVAVIGATGAVGQVFMWMLSDHPWFELSYVTASAARVGQKYGATAHWVMPFEMPE